MAEAGGQERGNILCGKYTPPERGTEVGVHLRSWVESEMHYWAFEAAKGPGIKAWIFAKGPPAK